MQQLWGRAGAVVSMCMQQLVGRVGSRSRHSDAIRCNQMPSYAIRCHHEEQALRRNQTQSDVITCHRRASDAIRCPQMLYAHLTCAMRTKPMPHAMCNQMQSDALRCNQMHSDLTCAMRTKPIPHAMCNGVKPSSGPERLTARGPSTLPLLSCCLADCPS
jgi:hypothetical protein